ncbi:MAG: flippase [Pseudomonadota bacterium]
MKLDRVRPYLNNTLWMLAEKSARILVGIFLFAYIARYLGPAEFGVLSYAVVLAAFCEPLIALGLNRILVRDLVKFPQQEGQLLGTVFVCRLVIALLCMVGLGALAYFSVFGSDQARPLVIALALGNLFLALSVIELFFQARLKAKFASLYKTGAFLLASLLKLALVLGEAPLLFFAIANSLELVFAGVLGLLTFRRNFGDSAPWRFHSATARRLLLESWPEVLAGICTLLCLRLDQFMLEHLVGVEELGIFAVAARLTDAWYFVPVALVSATFPGVVAQREVSHEGYLRSLQNLLLLLTAVSYAIVLPTVLLSHLLIDWLFGEAYQQAASMLAIYILCLPLIAWGSCSGSWIFAEGRIKLTAYRTILGASVNFVLNVTLIPLWGGHGAALATVLSLFVAFYLFDLCIKDMRVLFVMKSRALVLWGLVSYLMEYLPRQERSDAQEQAGKDDAK